MFDVENLIKYRENQLLSYRGYYNHVAMIFEKNNIHRPLCYGTNYLVDIYDHQSIHAEHDALNKLKKNRTSKLKKINILVIRYTTTLELTNSKPCITCLDKMKWMALQKGYRVNKVFYSGFREIHSNKFDVLFSEEKKHIPNRQRRKI